MSRPHSRAVLLPQLRLRGAATVLVSWDGEDQRKIHEFHGPIDGFATQKDSESWGVAFGTKWINDGKPDFTSPVNI